MALETNWKSLHEIENLFWNVEEIFCLSGAIQTSFAIGSCKTIMKYGWTITKVITPV